MGVNIRLAQIDSAATRDDFMVRRMEARWIQITGEDSAPRDGRRPGIQPKVVTMRNARSVRRNAIM